MKYGNYFFLERFLVGLMSDSIPFRDLNGRAATEGLIPTYCSVQFAHLPELLPGSAL